MENNEILKVFDELQNTYLGKRLDDYKVVVKCPICGEGGKQRNHGHCYVGLIDNHPPLVYHCFINECSGVVNSDFLRNIGIDDIGLISIVNAFNRSKNYMENEYNNSIYRIYKRKVEIPDIKDNDRNFYKLCYISKRLGIKFTYENIKSLKIIFSIKDFLELNKLPVNPKYKRIIKLLEEGYLGFLSINNDYIIFRNTLDNDNLRYFKYDIFGSIDNSNIIYNLPGVKCDIFSDEVVLNIAEGPFDVLGIFCNICNFNRENNIYAACCGSGYINAIKHFIRMGFIGNLKVNIFSDSDKKPNYYQKTYMEIEPWVKSINIIYNRKSKDYGVIKNEIELERISNKAIWKGGIKYDKRRN